VPRPNTRQDARHADYFVGHHPTMPGSGKTAQAIDAARCLEDSAHASMMTSLPHPGKGTAASSTGLWSFYAPLVRQSPPSTSFVRVTDDSLGMLRSWPLWRFGFLVNLTLAAAPD
jgi:hypothetical protein